MDSAGKPVQAQAIFRSLLGTSVNTRCVFTGFSPNDIRAFRGAVAFADPPHANTPLRNGQQVRGNICVILRGGGSFFEKALRAAEAGASGIVFVNNVDDVFFAECDGEPCDLPSVVIPMGAYQRLADLRLLDPITWCIEVDSSSEVVRGEKFRLQLTVGNASGLRNAEGDSDLCPFVEVMCGDSVRRTHPHPHSANGAPLWNQRMTFLLAPSVTHLSIRCLDQASLAGTPDLIGLNAAVPLDKVLQAAPGSTSDVQVPLRNIYDTPAGTVYLQMKLAPVIPTRVRAQRGVVQVVIMSAEGVQVPAHAPVGEQFVKVGVGNMAKRTLGGCKAVGADAGAQALVWNEGMSFLLPPGHTAETGLQIDLEVWGAELSRGVASSPLCEGSTTLTNMFAKGHAWEDWVPLSRGTQGTGGRVRIRVTCDEVASSAPHGACKDGDAQESRRARASGGEAVGLFDAELGLCYMMLGAFLLAIPQLRELLVWKLLPAMLLSMTAGLCLLLIGLLVKRRVFAPWLIRTSLGLVFGTGHFEAGGAGGGKRGAGGGRGKFVSDVRVREDVSIYELYCFLFSSGRLVFNGLLVPQPAVWERVETELCRAESVRVEMDTAALWGSRRVRIQVCVQQFDMTVYVESGFESNLLALARSIEASLTCLMRVAGRVEWEVELLRFERGTLRIVSSEVLGGSLIAPVVVPVDSLKLYRLSAQGLGWSAGGTRASLEGKVKRVTWLLLQAVADAQRCAKPVELGVDLDSVWPDIDSNEDVDDGLVGAGHEVVVEEGVGEGAGRAGGEDEGPEHIAF